MKRRQFIKNSVAAGMIVGLGGGGYLWLDGETKDLTIEAAIKKLDTFVGSNIASTGEWKPSQIFIHCAQSVEYSMIGYPEHKSEFFKNTAGQLAFYIFSSKGSMLHGLNEPIPGAAPLDGESDTQTALSRLRKSLVSFEQYKGELAPHFAYGSLSKQNYKLAHVMHLNNHLEEIVS